MFQAQNRETINSTWTVTVIAASFKIIMTTSVTRSCFTTQHQTCTTKTKNDFLISDRSCHKTDGLRPHHWYIALFGGGGGGGEWTASEQFAKGTSTQRRPFNSNPFTVYVLEVTGCRRTAINKYTGRAKNVAPLKNCANFQEL